MLLSTYHLSWMFTFFHPLSIFLKFYENLVITSNPFCLLQYTDLQPHFLKIYPQLPSPPLLCLDFFWNRPLTVFQDGVFASISCVLSLSSVLGRFIIHLYWDIQKKNKQGGGEGGEGRYGISRGIEEIASGFSGG